LLIRIPFTGCVKLKAFSLSSGECGPNAYFSDSCEVEPALKNLVN
jgi:hypothetical protein